MGSFAVARLPKLAPKNLLLHFARRMIVVIIEPHLAPRNHARMLRQLIQPRKMLFGSKLRLMRMNSNRRVNPVVLFGKRNRRVQPVRPRPASNREQRPHARRARAFEHRRPILIELRKLQVRV